MTGHIDYIKYNRERLPQFRTETTVITTPEGRKVRKRALSDEGVNHILNVFRGGQLLRERLRDVNVPPMIVTDDSVLCDYIEGRSFEHDVLAAALDHDRTVLIAQLLRYKTYLQSLLPGEVNVPVQGLVQELLRGLPTSALQDLMPVANLDLTFDNIIIDRDGHHWITDHEWIFDSAVPTSFIIYRSLYVLYLRQNRRIVHLLPFEDALAVMDVDPELWEPYRQACEKFIDLVLGEDRAHVIASHHLKAVHQLARLTDLQRSEQNLRASTNELADTRRALEEMLVNAQEREGRLQDQERRLGELSDSLERSKTSLAEKDNLLGTLHIELDSEKLCSSSLHGQLDVEKDHAFRLIRELEGEKVFSRQMENELQQSQNDLRIAKEAMTAMESALIRKDSELEAARASISGLTQERDQEFVRLQEMTDRYMSKQAELMTMSDWARSMRTRLDFMESIPTIRRVECVARTQKMAMDKIRSDGLWPTLKSVVLKSAPAQVQRMFYRPELSNMEDLEKDAHGRDVLVVFPVIPWEFRWQRPQQLVSRFAENGYTVVFVHMTLESAERRYLNDNEAMVDVGLGKLREHLYEVRLRSFGKINVYQDRIKGANLNNLARGLGGVLKQLSPRSVTYAVQFPGWGQLAMMMRNRISGNLIFDCMDDHAGFSNNSSEVVRRETQLMKRSDLVVTSSAKLYEKAAAFNDNTILVRNGTDFELFNQLSPNGKLDGMRKPIIGYHGAISEWFDPEVVAVTAEKHPEWNFVLIGSTLGCDVARLKKLSNVQLLGELPYRDLPGYLYYFDVCIIPFRVTPLTMATNPVKFYEYISSGKPVVSVRLPEMVQYQDVCYLYENQSEFEEGIGAALQESDPDMLDRRIEVARDSSWDQRFLDIEKKLDEMRGDAHEERRRGRILK